MAKVMDAFRAAPPTELAGSPVVRVLDYRKGIALEVATRAEEPLTLPSSNVLAFELGNGGRVTLRPSGTEPKIKYYFDLVEPVAPDEELAAAEVRARAALDRLAADWLARAARP
jgi:phosphomannomutase